MNSIDVTGEDGLENHVIRSSSNDIYLPVISNTRVIWHIENLTS